MSKPPLPEVLLLRTFLICPNIPALLFCNL